MKPNTQCYFCLYVAIKMCCEVPRCKEHFCRNHAKEEKSLQEKSLTEELNKSTPVTNFTPYNYTFPFRED